MDSKTRSALESLDTAARRAVDIFIKKYYDEAYAYAIADDPIGVWGIGDEFWNFNDIVTALQYDADESTLYDWYYEIYADGNKQFISLKLWLKGVRPKGLGGCEQAEAKK